MASNDEKIQNTGLDTGPMAGRIVDMDSVGMQVQEFLKAIGGITEEARKAAPNFNTLTYRDKPNELERQRIMHENFKNNPEFVQAMYDNFGEENFVAAGNMGSISGEDDAGRKAAQQAYDNSYGKMQIGQIGGYNTAYFVDRNGQYVIADDANKGVALHTPGGEAVANTVDKYTDALAKGIADIVANSKLKFTNLQEKENLYKIPEGPMTMDLLRQIMAEENASVKDRQSAFRKYLSRDKDE